MFLLTSAVGTPKQLAAMGTNFISSFITYTMYNEIIKISPKYVQKLPNKKKTKMECKRKTRSHSTLQKSQSLREDTISATGFLFVNRVFITLPINHAQRPMKRLSQKRLILANSVAQFESKRLRYIICTEESLVNPRNVFHQDTNQTLVLHAKADDF